MQFEEVKQRLKSHLQIAKETLSKLEEEASTKLTDNSSGNKIHVDFSCGKDLNQCLESAKPRLVIKSGSDISVYFKLNFDEKNSNEKDSIFSTKSTLLHGEDFDRRSICFIEVFKKNEETCDNDEIDWICENEFVTSTPKKHKKLPIQTKDLTALHSHR